MQVLKDAVDILLACTTTCHVQLLATCPNARVAPQAAKHQLRLNSSANAACCDMLYATSILRRQLLRVKQLQLLPEWLLLPPQMQQHLFRPAVYAVPLLHAATASCC